MIFTKKIIVFDIAIPHFRNNRVFNREYAMQYPGASVLASLKAIANDHDWQIITGDIFLKYKPKFDRAVCLSNEATPELISIVNSGVELGVLTSGESPNVAWSFYHNLPRLSKGFRHACLFKGFSSRIHPGTKFHVHHWPMPDIKPPIDISFADRRILCMVSSFKERFGFNRQKLSSRIIAPLRWARILYYQNANRNARFPDLYKIRIDAVRNFAARDDFFLFGYNWDVAQRYVKEIRNLSFANKPSFCDNKIHTLSSFRFTLAFENCIFPGYVTEKIFDAMLAGTVPIYLGAPDIEDYVTKDCFIDYRDYEDFQSLWQDILSWSEDKWLKKREAIKDFLESSAYLPFKEDQVALNYFNWLTEGK